MMGGETNVIGGEGVRRLVEGEERSESFSL